MRLPPRSRVWQELNADAAWSDADYLAAAQVDMTATVAWLNSDGSDSDRPKPVERPADRRAAIEKARRNDARAQRALARRGINITK